VDWNEVMKELEGLTIYQADVSNYFDMTSVSQRPGTSINDLTLVNPSSYPMRHT
jgi:hypothetical protein